jgi:hypothetical protein
MIAYFLSDTFVKLPDGMEVKSNQILEQWDVLCAGDRAETVITDRKLKQSSMTIL